MLASIFRENASAGVDGGRIEGVLVVGFDRSEVSVVKDSNGYCKS
jgi:hypothetical protein